jgi:hypothetical protein
MKTFSQQKTEIILFAFLLCVYLVSGFDVTITNDSFSNIEQIAMMDLLHRSSHFGFHFIAISSHVFFKLIGISDPISSTQFVLSLVSVLGSIALYRIVLAWRNDATLALVSTLIYALNTNVWRFSIQNEYHILIPALCLIAIAFWLHKKYFIGSMVFGLAMLTSPFAVFSLPLFFIEKPNLNIKIIIKAFLGFIIVVGFVSVFTYEETISGEWSYDIVYSYYKDTLSITNPVRILSILIYGYLRAFHLLLIPLLILLIKFKKTESRILILLLISFIIHLPAAIPENRYGAYQMTLYPLVSIACGIVLVNFYDKKRFLIAFLCIAFISFSTYIVLEERAFHRSLARHYNQMQNDPNLADGSYVFMYKAIKPFNVKYAKRLEGISVYSSYHEKMTGALRNYKLPNYKDLLKGDTPVYLIESSVSKPDDYLKSIFSNFTKNQGAKFKGIGIQKIKGICPDARFEEIKGYPLTLYQVSCN